MTPTVDILKAAYAYLNETPPFNEWNLPDDDDVVFEIWTGTDWHGGCHPPYGNRAGYTIGISATTHSHTVSLISSTAHEMVHVHLHKIKYRGWKNHGPAFKALAKEVCDAHGFDPGQF